MRFASVSLPKDGGFFTPLHKPFARHVSAFSLVHVRVVGSPLTTDVGSAFSVTLMTGTLTATYTVWLVLPVAPVQVSVNAVLAMRLSELSDPDFCLFPGQEAEPPDPTQPPVAKGASQVKVVLRPASMLVGAAANEIDGPEERGTMAQLG